MAINVERISRLFSLGVPGSSGGCVVAFRYELSEMLAASTDWVVSYGLISVRLNDFNFNWQNGKLM